MPRETSTEDENTIAELDSIVQAQAAEIAALKAKIAAAADILGTTHCEVLDDLGNTGPVTPSGDERATKAFWVLVTP